MKEIFIFIFTALCNIIFGQAQISSVKQNPNIYIFNNALDTIYLSAINLGQFTITESCKIVDSIQIDGLGAKEIVFLRTCSGNTEEHGGTFDISESKTISKYEIWNTDTKTLLFEAVNNFTCEYNRWSAFTPSTPDSEQGLFRTGKGNYAYTYALTINNTGQITISNVKITNECFADKQDGLYKFINGKYIME